MDAIAEFKLNIVQNFNLFIDRVNSGYMDDYQHILDQIAFIDSYSSLTSINTLMEFLKNGQNSMSF